MAALASGYQGPPELTFASAFTRWTADLPVIALVVAVVATFPAVAAHPGAEPRPRAPAPPCPACRKCRNHGMRHSRHDS